MFFQGDFKLFEAFSEVDNLQLTEWVDLLHRAAKQGQVQAMDTLLAIAQADVDAKTLILSCTICASSSYLFRRL